MCIVKRLISYARTMVLIFPMVLSACSSNAVQSDIEMSLYASLNDFRNRLSVPGITAAIVFDDGREAAAAVGFADLETLLPMRSETPMLAASIGKTFVAATILSLASEGKVALDAKVASYLPADTWFSQLPNADVMTIRHLLTHSSGLPDHLNDVDFLRAFPQRVRLDEDPFTQEELLGFLLDKPALFPAGEGWSYTDTGYILLGLLIERVTGQAWTKQVEVRFLKPLELTSTKPSNHKDLVDLAAGYLAVENPYGLPVKTVGGSGEMLWNPAIESAGGGFMSTSLDLARWGDALYRGLALPQEMSEELLSAVPMTSDDPTSLYGAGVSIVNTSEFGLVYGHAGHIPGYVSSLRHYPEFGATVAFQINTDIGLTDGPDNPVGELEQELARTAKQWSK